MLKREGLLWFTFYLDDGVLLGPRDNINRAFQVLQQGFQALGLQVNAKKCSIWGPGVTPGGVQSAGLSDIPAKAFTRNSGVTVLGIPIDAPGGREHTATVWDEALNGLRSACDALSDIPDPQLQHVLLRTCLDACKLQHLLRATECFHEKITTRLVDADSIITGVFEDAVGAPLGLRARVQAALPIRMGGCGIRLPSNVRPAARVAALVSHTLQTGELIGLPRLGITNECSDWPLLLTDLRRQLGEAFAPLATWASRPRAVASADKQQAKQSWWAEQLHERTAKSLFEGADGRDRVRLESQKGPLGGAWMRLDATDSMRTAVTPEDYRVGLKWWLGIPLLATSITCPACGKLADKEGDHFVCCQKKKLEGRSFAVQEWLVPRVGCGK
jgi:hypothetical protein